MSGPTLLYDLVARHTGYIHTNPATLKAQTKPPRLKNVQSLKSLNTCTSNQQMSLCTNIKTSVYSVKVSSFIPINNFSSTVQFILGRLPTFLFIFFVKFYA